jgi:type VI secretion system protein ImpF
MNASVTTDKMLSRKEGQVGYLTFNNPGKLNAVSLDAVVDLEPYPQVRHSVLNYGLPDISGHTAASIDTTTLEKSLQRAIYAFEPRIIANSLRVRVNPDVMSHNSLEFRIEGAVFEQPMPFQVSLRSKLDLECGEFVVREDRN